MIPHHLNNTILHLCDAGYTPVQISAAFPHLKLADIYALLRVQRPGRKRAPRRRSSVLPDQMIALRKAGVLPMRIATLLEVSRAYVYRILSE